MQNPPTESASAHRPATEEQVQPVRDWDRVNAVIPWADEGRHQAPGTGSQCGIGPLDLRLPLVVALVRFAGPPSPAESASPREPSKSHLARICTGLGIDSRPPSRPRSHPPLTTKQLPADALAPWASLLPGRGAPEPGIRAPAIRSRGNLTIIRPSSHAPVPRTQRQCAQAGPRHVAEGQGADALRGEPRLAQCLQGTDHAPMGTSEFQTSSSAAPPSPRTAGEIRPGRQLSGCPLQGGVGPGALWTASGTLHGTCAPGHGAVRPPGCPSQPISRTYRHRARGNRPPPTARRARDSPAAG